MSNIENLSLVRKLTFYLQLDWFPLFYCLDIFFETFFEQKQKSARIILCHQINFLMDRDDKYRIKTMMCFPLEEKENMFILGK